MQEVTKISTRPANSKELDRNRRVYSAEESSFSKDDLGQVALYHEGRLIEIHPDFAIAYKVGCERFKLGNFSLITIGGLTEMRIASLRRDKESPPDEAPYS